MSADERHRSSAVTGTGQGEDAATEKPGVSQTLKWWIYRGTGRPLRDIDLRDLLSEPPPWRTFDGGDVLEPPPEDEADLARRLGPLDNLRTTGVDPREVDAVNAALLLRRPLLVSGKPGVGKSSLAYRISRELRLGPVLRWPISSRSTRQSGLYEYDAIGRAQDAAATRSPAKPSQAPPNDSPGIGDYLRLGPLGTALLPYELPRVLLIGELDKSNIDLPNDLLEIFEEGAYQIPELVRLSARHPGVKVYTADPGARAVVRNGYVQCKAFPVIIITSNAEREFPPAFLRRCLRLNITEPDEDRLASMIAAHFANSAGDELARQLLHQFLEHRRAHGDLAADQLLNAVYLATSGRHIPGESWQRLIDLVWQRLGQPSHYEAVE